MVVVGGVVAYIADNLGRTLGKKRLTLFHMRPRHTATLITVLAGMLIPFITVVFVATVSEDARQWLAAGHSALKLRDDAFRQRDHILATNEGLRAEREDLLNQKKTLVTSVAGLKLENKVASERAIGFRRDIAALKLDLVSYKSQVRNWASRVSLLTGELNSMKGQLSSTSQNLAEVRTKRDKVQKQYAEVNGAFKEISRQYTDVNLRYMQLTSDYEKMGATLTRLDKDKTDLEEKNFKVRQQLADNKAQLDTVAMDLDRANASLAIANQQLTNAQKLVATDFNTSRFKPIIVGMGDELARVSVPANTSAEDAAGILNNLLKQAKLVASQKGAKPRTDDDNIGSTQVLQSGEPAGLFTRLDEKQQPITPADQEQTIIKGITGSKEDLVLVASSFANTFEGEWVPLDVHAYSNPVVYKRSQVIAEGKINSFGTDDDLYQQISDFLRMTVRPKALKDRMIPSGHQLGEVSTNDILDTLKKIRSAERPVRLVARAVAETRAADPLHLRLEVK